MCAREENSDTYIRSPVSDAVICVRIELIVRGVVRVIRVPTRAGGGADLDLDSAVYGCFDLDLDRSPIA